MGPLKAKRWVFYAFLLALVIRLAHLCAIAQTPIPEWQKYDVEADFSATWAWAASIRGGNLLGNPPPHPFPTWMRRVGTRAEWDGWLGGELLFQQAPLYAYAVALATDAPKGKPLWLFFWQALLGAACVGGVASLASRWGGPLAGVLAAFIWALTRTEVALDVSLLRDAVAMPLVLAALCLLERLRTPGTHRGTALCLGVLLGLGALERENVVVLMLAALPLSAWLLGRDATQAIKGAQRAGIPALVLGGFLLAWTPLIARNLHVGVSPLALSNRGPEVILTGLSVRPGSDVIFRPGNHVYPAIRADLEAARGSSLRALGIVLEAGRHQPLALVRVLARKGWALLCAGEPGDNIDLDYLAQKSWILRMCLPTGVLIAPALFGVGLALRFRRRAAVGLVAFAVFGGLLLATVVVWRFRAGILPVAVPFIGVALAWLWSVRRAPRALAPAAVFILGMTAFGYLYSATPVFSLRPYGAALSVTVDLEHGDAKAALEEINAYDARVSRGEALRYPALDQIRERLHRP